MKNQKWKSILCLLCAATMIFGASGCKKSHPQNQLSEYDSDYYEDDSAEEESSTVTDSNAESSSQETVTSSTTNSQSTKKTNLTRDQVIASMPEKLKNTTIKYMTWDNPKQSMEKDAIADFEKKTGIKVQIDMVALDQKFDVLASRVAAGNSPDVFRTDEAWPWICKNLQPIENLNYNFNDSAWNTDLMNYFKFDGRTYSMQLADTPFTPVAVLYYNKSALKKAEMDNVDPYKIWKNNPDDWTWDKFFSICDTFLSRNGNKDGYFGSIFNSTYIYGYIRCFGLSNVNYNTTTGKYESMVSSPEYVKRMEILSDAIQKKWITNDAQGFEMGQILFDWDWSLNAQANNVYFGNLKKNNNLGIVPIPTDSTKQVLYQHMGHGVPVGAKNAEAVPYFIRYIQDRKGYSIENIYSVPNSAEVIEWSLQQGNKNKNFYVGDTIHNYEYITKIIMSPSSQVKSICDTYAPTFASTANDLNNSMTGLPK